MLVQPTFLSLACLLSSATSALIAWYCWLRHEVIGAREYAVVAVSQSLWTIGFIFELASTDLSGKIFWDNAQFVAAAGWIAAFLAFTLRYTERRLSRLAAALVAAPLIALIVLAYSDQLHGLIRPNVRLVPGEPYDALLYDVAGPLWALAIYIYGAYLGGVLVLLFTPARSSPLYQRQIGLLVTGSLVPVAGTVVTLSLLADSPVRDISPFTFAVSSLLVVLSLFRFRLFDLVPIARDVVVESITDAVFVLDTRGRLVDLNPAARRLAEALGLDIRRRGAELLPDAFRPTIARSDKGGHNEIRELALPTSDGICQIELRLQPVLGRRGARVGCVAVARDVTRRKAVEAELQTYHERLEALVEVRTADLRATNELLQQEIDRRQQLEAQIVQGQKLEALGRMASGIAHDFNNVLTVVRGATELIIAQRASDDPDMPDLVAILQATTQAAGLTHQLLAFSRGQRLQLVPLDLATVVAEFADILRRLAGPRIVLRLELHPGATTVLADIVQVRQVLANLVTNGSDAMPDGGQLTIGVGRCDHVEPGQGQPVQLTVADSGTGMDELTRQRLFEPFFTTKEPGRGTGLGLPVVYGIVTQLGGEIQVESAPGRGTTFTIDLPPIESSPLWDRLEHEPPAERSPNEG